MSKIVKHGADYLRHNPPTPQELSAIKRNPIYLVLDNVLDTYNIGSIFRLADAVGVGKVYLCGNMEYPPSSRIHKAAVGTEEWVPWEKVEKTEEIIKKLKEKGVLTIAVEQDTRSIPFANLSQKLKFPCAVIVGNETTGVSEKASKLADLIVELPMLGVNKSFNVWGSAAVVCYKLIENLT